MIHRFLPAPAVAAGFLALIALAAVPALGQQGKPQQADSRLSVIALPPKVEHPEMHLLQEEGRSVPLELVANRLAGPLRVAHNGHWRFAEKAEADAVTGGKPKLAASCRALPARDQCVVLVRKPGEESGYGAFAVSLDPATFGQRQFLLINLSAIEIAYEIGGTKGALSPGKPVVASPKANLGPDLCQADFYFRDNGEWKPFINTRWPLRDKVRGVVFFYQNADGKRIHMHAVTDFLE